MELHLARGIQKIDEERHQLLSDASELLSCGTNYEATLERVAQLLVRNLASWCCIDLINDSGGVDRVAVAHRDVDKLRLAQTVQLHYPARPSATRGVYRVITTQKSILIPVLSQEDWARRADDETHLRVLMELGSTSYMCVPLLVGTRAVGAIMLLSDERTYSGTDLETAEQVSRRIATAVDNVLLFRRLQMTLDELQATQDQLVQSSKMAALGVISTGLAHEINNPLTVIRYFLCRLEDGLPKDDSSRAPRDHIRKIDGAVERIVKVVGDVKEFSRQTSQMFSPVDLKALIDSTLLALEPAVAAEKIQLIRRDSMSELFVLGDGARLQLALQHILANAREAIRARPPGIEAGSIVLELSQVGGVAFLRITDNGIGLPSASRDRVFEPFFTTKEVGKGVGLGLSVAHGIVKDHRGEIHFFSQVNDGAEVTITIPLAPQSKYSNEEITRYEGLRRPQAFGPAKPE